MNSIEQDKAIEKLQKDVEELKDHLLRLSKEVLRLNGPRKAQEFGCSS